MVGGHETVLAGTCREPERGARVIRTRSVMLDHLERLSPLGDAVTVAVALKAVMSMPSKSSATNVMSIASGVTNAGSGTGLPLLKNKLSRYTEPTSTGVGIEVGLGTRDNI